MKRAQFEELVLRAIADLPQEFKQKLENVAILIQDEPSNELLQTEGVPEGETLFGLYEGVPLTERGFEAPLYPDRIWIFQKPIEDACYNDAEITAEIRTTILHEIAHFFGIDDDALEEMGY